MRQRTVYLGVLFVGALLSAWLLQYLTEGHGALPPAAPHDPDYYMEDFTTLTMDRRGQPKNRLRAIYMAHYPDDDTTEFQQPELEIYRRGRLPLFVSADKGWASANNEVILLRGNVRLWEDDEAGARILDVQTSEARVLMDDEYAESDQSAVINTKNSTISGIGMRAYLNDSRLEIIRHEHTTIR
jgi:lipopolysaccharide export system protein LptC